MRIIVIADTHMPQKAKVFPDQLIEEIKKADLIIHAGDWESREVYDELCFYGTVEGVIGNTDGPELAECLPEKKIIEIEGYKIGIVHGHGGKQTTEKRAEKAFGGEELDCIIFGHSHIPYLRYSKGVLLFNPGSITDKRRVPYYSYGILSISDHIRAEHIFIKS